MTKKSDSWEISRRSTGKSRLPHNYLGDLTKTQDALAADAEVGAAKEIENRFPKASKSSASDSELSG